MEPTIPRELHEQACELLRQLEGAYPFMRSLVWLRRVLALVCLVFGAWNAADASLSSSMGLVHGAIAAFNIAVAFHVIVPTEREWSIWQRERSYLRLIVKRQIR